MNEFFQQLQQDVLRIWGGLSRTQQLIFGAVALASVAAIVTLVLWAQTPEWTPLFTGLEATDAGQIVDKLKDAKVPYLIQGDAVMVPKSRAAELRMSMASQGLPQGGTVGYEIFDKNQFGMTDALQRLNYQRALQGELARTIGSLGGVEKVRVGLVIPEKDLFTDNTSEPTAAVMLTLRQGSRFSMDQARTVVHLVAKSVQGMKESNVVISDTTGRNYTDELGLNKDPNSSTSPEMTVSQLEIKKQVESGLRKNLQATLDRVLGANNSVVTVAADLDFSQVETNEETYSPVTRDPAGQAVGILRSSKETHEVYNGPGSPNGGVPGMSSNISGGANASLPTYQSTDASGSGSYQKHDLTKNFEDNKRVTRKIKAPSEIKRLSVAVVINGELEPEQIQGYRDLVTGAAGIDRARGDTVVVTAQKFNDTEAKAEQVQADKAEQNQQLLGYIKIGAGLLVGVLALVLLRRGLVGRQTAFDDGPLALEAFDEASRAAAPGAIGTIGEDDRKTHLQKEITKVVKSQPADVAKLLKSWMIEDE